MNIFARFDENPAMTLQDIKETKRYGQTEGRTYGQTHGHCENSIPTTNKVFGGYNYPFFGGLQHNKASGYAPVIQIIRNACQVCFST